MKKPSASERADASRLVTGDRSHCLSANHLAREGRLAQASACSQNAGESVLGRRIAVKCGVVMLGRRTRVGARKDCGERRVICYGLFRGRPRARKPRPEELA